jgi:hypothetical protein
MVSSFEAIVEDLRLIPSDKLEAAAAAFVHRSKNLSVQEREVALA